MKCIHILIHLFIPKYILNFSNILTGCRCIRLPVHQAAFRVAEGSVWLTPVVLVVYPALLPCLVAGNSSPMFRGGALGTECLDGCCGHDKLLEISHSESKCYTQSLLWPHTWIKVVPGVHTHLLFLGVLINFKVSILFILIWGDFLPHVFCTCFFVLLHTPNLGHI